MLALGFNEGTGTTTADVSGNGNNGTISGATWTTSGKHGNALSFDGTNDLVTITDAASLDLTTGMTLEAWVNPSALNSWETVILKEASGELAYALYADNNGNDSGGPRRPTTWIRQGATSYSTVGTSQLATNQWTHLAATHAGAVVGAGGIRGVCFSACPSVRRPAAGTHRGRARSGVHPVRQGGPERSV